MEVPPPLRRPPWKVRRAAIVGVASLLAAVAIAGVLGRAAQTWTCAVCASSRKATEVGLFWGRDAVLTGTIESTVAESQAYADTLAAWGHVHTWHVERRRPQIFVPSFFVRTTSCPRPLAAFDHNPLALQFCTDPELRRHVAALVAAGEWTPVDVGDALRHCEYDEDCRIDACLVDFVTAERRQRANDRLQALPEAWHTHRKGRLRTRSPPAGDGER